MQSGNGELRNRKVCHHWTNPGPAKSGKTIHTWGQRLWICGRSSTPATERGWQTTPYRLLFKYTQQGRKELRHLRPGTPSNRQSIGALETISSWIPSQGQSIFKSHESTVFVSTSQDQQMSHKGSAHPIRIWHRDSPHKREDQWSSRHPITMTQLWLRWQWQPRCHGVTR